MIKKLILSTLIILGIVASTQAQSNTTFDFSCADEVTVFISDTQATQLVAASFVRGYNAETDVIDYNHYAYVIGGSNVQLTRVTMDAHADGYDVIVGILPSDLPTTYPTFARAFSAALDAVDALIQPEFSSDDETELAGAGFNTHVNAPADALQVYSFSFEGSDGTQYQVDITPHAHGFNVYDDDSGAPGERFHSTLAAAMADALARANN